MTQTSTYGMYGSRQEEFSYLCAESQTEIVEYCHALANMEHEARSMQVVQVCADGYVITQAMVDAEIARTTAARLAPAMAPMTTTDPTYTGFYGVSHFA